MCFCEPCWVTNAPLLCFFSFLSGFPACGCVLVRGISAKLKTGKSDYMKQGVGLGLKWSVNLWLMHLFQQTFHSKLNLWAADQEEM
jgi:hypothetical protein